MAMQMISDAVGGSEGFSLKGRLMMNVISFLVGGDPSQNGGYKVTVWINARSLMRGLVLVLGAKYMVGWVQSVLRGVYGWLRANALKRKVLADRRKYTKLKMALATTSFPAAFVDITTFDRNVRRLVSIAQYQGKKLRIATKSIRVPALIKRVQEIGKDAIQGFMCYSVQEASFLANEFHLDDFLVAYPTVQVSDLRAAYELMKSGRKITLMVDCVEHVRVIQMYINRFIREEAGDENPVTSAAQPQEQESTMSSTSNSVSNTRLGICIDIDVSWRPLGGRIHIGVQRSGIRSIADFERVLNSLLSSSRLQFVGCMGYEAHIAGLPDANPHQPWLNIPKRILKVWSDKHVVAFRSQVFAYLEKRKISIEFFNGGGTGSLVSTGQDPVITEVSAGSGFLQSQLFDYYVNNVNMPALMFALQVTRKPESGVVVVQSGGFAMSSGEIHKDKAPSVIYPTQMQYTSREGFGEVQTPLIGPFVDQIHIGDPIILRPAKAGELAEHFNQYYVMENDQLLPQVVKTYRGFGCTFK